MKSNQKREWFDDDALWRNWYPFLFDEKKFEQAEAETERLLKLVDLGDRKSILDLGCGPGRFAIPLARKGHSVTGVDRCAYFLNRGRARARKAEVQIAWRKRDMREFSQPDTFDLAINMWSSFGYFEDRGDDLKALELARSSLKPGGKILIDNLGKELYARMRNHTWAQERDDGSLFIDTGKVVDDWTRVQRSWLTIIGDRLESRFDFSLNLYSGQEMRELMERAGFEDVALYGDLTGNPYDGMAKRQITIACRPLAG